MLSYHTIGVYFIILGMSLNFYLIEGEVNNHIRLRYTYNRNSRTDFYCGVTVKSKKHFNKDNKDFPIRSSDKESESKNRILKKLKRDVEDIIDSIVLNKQIPTSVLVKSKFKSLEHSRVYNTDVENRINQYFVIKTIDEYIDESKSRVDIGDNLKKSSYEKLKRMMNKWKDFFEYKKQQSIQFEELRNRFGLFREFSEFCLNDENQFANSTINKYSSTFRNFLRWSSKKDFHNIDVRRFDSPNLKEVSRRTILSLTPKQLKSIFEFKEVHYLNDDGSVNVNCEKYKDVNDRNFYIEDKFTQRTYKKDGTYTEKDFVKKYTSLEVYKDFFCFLCSTSLSYIDGSNVKISDYNFDSDCFELVRIKTNTPTTIPMNEMSRSIWMKYSKDKNGKLKKGVDFESHYLFPRFKGNKFYSNQNCNDGLKRIGELLKDDLDNLVNVEVVSGGGIRKGSEKEVPLYKVLHTHIGRKTFINFALSQKISVTDIKKISGHSDEKMLKYYVNSLRDEVKEEFQMMSSFMTDGEFIGSKGKDKSKLKVEDNIHILLNQKKNKSITDEQFNKEMKKLIK